MTEEERDDLLNEIVQRETRMFTETPIENGASEFQQRPEAFRLTRLMAHSAHGEDFLRSYLKDLEDAKKTGRNFVAEKYARMDNLIPPLNEDPLLDQIAKAETDWLAEASRMYPAIIKGAGSEQFRQFLRCELETLSDDTLAIYGDEIKKAEAEKRNLAIERHNWLARKLGGKPLKNAPAGEE